MRKVCTCHILFRFMTTFQAIQHAFDFCSKRMFCAITRTLLGHLEEGNFGAGFDQFCPQLHFYTTYVDNFQKAKMILAVSSARPVLLFLSLLNEVPKWAACRFTKQNSVHYGLNFSVIWFSIWKEVINCVSQCSCLSIYVHKYVFVMDLWWYVRLTVYHSPALISLNFLKLGIVAHKWHFFFPSHCAKE